MWLSRFIELLPFIKLLTDLWNKFLSHILVVDIAQYLHVLPSFRLFLALRAFPKTRPGILKQGLGSNKLHSFFSLYRVFLSNNQCYVCNSIVPNKSEPQWDCEALSCCSFMERKSCSYTCCKGQQFLCSAHSAATTTTLLITIDAS